MFKINFRHISLDPFPVNPLQQILLKKSEKVSGKWLLYVMEYLEWIMEYFGTIFDRLKQHSHTRLYTEINDLPPFPFERFLHLWDSNQSRAWQLGDPWYWSCPSWTSSWTWKMHLSCRRSDHLSTRSWWCDLVLVMTTMMMMVEVLLSLTLGLTYQWDCSYTLDLSVTNAIVSTQSNHYDHVSWYLRSLPWIVSTKTLRVTCIVYADEGASTTSTWFQELGLNSGFGCRPGSLLWLKGHPSSPTILTKWYWHGVCSWESLSTTSYYDTLSWCQPYLTCMHTTNYECGRCKRRHAFFHRGKWTTLELREVFDMTMSGTFSSLLGHKSLISFPREIPHFYHCCLCQRDCLNDETRI